MRFIQGHKHGLIIGYKLFPENIRRIVGVKLFPTNTDFTIRYKFVQIEVSITEAMQ